MSISDPNAPLGGYTESNPPPGWSQVSYGTNPDNQQFYWSNTSPSTDPNAIQYQYIPVQGAGEDYNGTPGYFQATASNAALNNPDIADIGLTGEQAQDLYDLKSSSPGSYYTQLANYLGGAGGYAQATGYTKGVQEHQQMLENILPLAQQAGVDPNALLSSATANWQNTARTINQNLSDANSGMGAVDNWATSNGWIIPLAGIAAMGGAAALGAGDLAAAPVADAAAADVATAPVAADVAAAPAAVDTGVAGGTGLTTGTGGTNGLLNASAGGAFDTSGAAATQSALGLGGAPTGLLTSSVGMGGTAGAGSLAGIAGSEAAAGLGGSALGTGLTADQLSQYESGGGETSTTPTLQQAANTLKAAQLAKGLLTPTASTGSSSISPQSLAQALNKSSTAQLIPFNTSGNPFAYTQSLPVEQTRTATPQALTLASLLK